MTDLEKLAAMTAKRWEGVIERVEAITAEEGASVSFICPNPDFNGLPNEAVMVCSSATNWDEITYRADTLAECLDLHLRALAREEG